MISPEVKTDGPRSSLFTEGKIAGRFRFVSVGDIHLKHPRTPTSLVLNNLTKYCVNDAVFKNLDIFFITGDLFDSLLMNNDPRLYEIHRWLTYLLYKCAEHDVLLRIVEGTPSHDREQSVFLTEQAVNAKIPVDVHYATTLSIEYVERFGIHILYVPDKWRTETTETLGEVKLLLKEKGIDQVDFAVMHGAFEYQLPEIVPEPSHDSEEYHRLVKCFILIGHVHKASQKGRILAAGSFDRDGHGNEEPKGYYDVTIFSNDDYQITFVENKDAKKYVGVDCVGLDSRESLIKISNLVSTLPKGSAVKIKCYATDPIFKEYKDLLEAFPYIEFTTDRLRDTREEAKVMEELMTLDFDVFKDITPESLPTLLMEEVNSLTSDENQRRRCLELIESVNTSNA
tara:strand:+ start:757 stop:1950 length:1194 start_codon:yes stop_codon:yes gene_type:complete